MQDIRLQPGDPKKVAEESELYTDSSRYNSNTRQAQLYHEELNTAMNHHIIVSRIKAGTARDVSDEPKPPDRPEKTPCIIIGSGPSLDDAIPFLKDWKGGLICSSSHALTLMKHGIEPSHIVALDPFSTWDEIKGVDWSKTRTKLVAHPGVWPTLIENWPNDILLYLENMGNPNSFYATTQKRMYSRREGDLRYPTFHYYIRTEVTLFACSPPIQLFIGEVLGYGTMFLSGVDFGFHSGKDRFTGWKIDGEGNWVEDPHPFDPEKADKADLVMSSNGLYSHTVHIYYKKNFLSAWNLYGKAVYTTDHGIMTEIPYADIKAVVKRQGYGYKPQSKAFIDSCTQPYLASVNAFIIDTDMGKSFVEASNPLVDLPQFMLHLLRRYICDVCKIKLTADGDVDQAGSECPHCKKGKLRHEVNVDMEANMKRIMGYVEKARRMKEARNGK